MPARRSSRLQKKTVLEALSRGPEALSDNFNTLSSSVTLDEVDGPTPAVADKKPFQRMRKKCTKNKTVTKQQKDREIEDNGQEMCVQDNMVGDVVSVLDKRGDEEVKKKLLVEETVCTTEGKAAKQKESVSAMRKTINLNKLDLESCQVSTRLQGRKTTSRDNGTGEKEREHQRDVKVIAKSTKMRNKPENKSSNPFVSDSNKDAKSKSAIDSKDKLTISSSMMTEGSSSSDSDFEEVDSYYRTPESSLMSSTYSDFGVCRKLEDSFSGYASSQGMSVSSLSSDVTDFNSPSCSGLKMDSAVRAVKAENDISARKNNNTGSTSSGKSTKKAVTAGNSKGKTAPKENIETENKPKTLSGKPKPSNPSQKASKSKSKPDSPSQKASKNKTATTHSGKVGKASEVDENNVMAILMKMEGQTTNADHRGSGDQKSTSGQSRRREMMSKKKAMSRSRANTESSEESDWEEVEDYKHSPVKSQIPDGPVEITIDDPTMMHKKRKKKEFDWKAYVQRRIKRKAREMQTEMHKVHLLCLLSHGLQQNSVCSDVTACATALSLVPQSQLQKDVAFYDDQTLVFFLKWFRSMFGLSPNTAESSRCLVNTSQLTQVIRDGTASESRLLVMVLVVMLRAMGFNVRLVISLYPLPLKLSSAALGKVGSKRKTNDKRETTSTSSKKPKKASQAHKPRSEENVKFKASKSVNAKEKPAKGKSLQQTSSGQNAAPSTGKKNQLARSGKETVRKRKQTTKSKKPARTGSSSSEDDDDDDSAPTVAKRRASGRTRNIVRPSTSAKDNDVVSDSSAGAESDGSNFSEEEEAVRKKIKARAKRKKQSGSADKDSVDMDEGSDGEFDRSFRTKSLLVEEGKTKRRANRKVLSEDSGEETTDCSGRDYWLEVYLPRQSKWFCVDCIRCVVGRPYDASSAASQPLLYVVGFENDGSIKDITAKYAPQWLSHTRKQRVDSEWWGESLDPFASSNTALDDQENRAIKDHLVQRPLPTSIGDFKNHPLYALRRHLLKYEAIYPENSIPVGYIRHEPVYARECVHTLHSRDNWLREARVVRLGETPYKLVKSRKRWNRARENPEELDLELFGRWQTEEFIPPPAVNGKVPKNEYGNVELFQPSMLPGGTVHVRVPALNRVAKKLGIDIAAAMTGWDHHCGYSHPVLDGWVVCEEHRDVLLAAWEEDQEILRQREEERREKRVLSNWTTLVRGLLIKEKLKKKFNLEEKTAPVEVKKKGKGKKGEKATDMQYAWPASQQQAHTAQREKPTPAPSHYTVETM